MEKGKCPNIWVEVGGYSFELAYAQQCLVQRCYSRGGRHDFVANGRAWGPNVFVDCYAANSQNETGSHMKYATGLLYDNIKIQAKQYPGDYGLIVRNRGQNHEHGQVGGQNVFWNFIGAESDSSLHTFFIFVR